MQTEAYNSNVNNTVHTYQLKKMFFYDTVDL